MPISILGMDNEYTMDYNKKMKKRKRENSGQRPPERRGIGTSGIIHLPVKYHYLGWEEHFRYQASNRARYGVMAKRPLLCS
jgi:hypothetical protein